MKQKPNIFVRVLAGTTLFFWASLWIYELTVPKSSNDVVLRALGISAGASFLATGGAYFISHFFAGRSVPTAPRASKPFQKRRVVRILAIGVGALVLAALLLAGDAYFAKKPTGLTFGLINWLVALAVVFGTGSIAYAAHVSLRR